MLCYEKPWESFIGEARIQVVTAGRKGLQEEKGLGKEGHRKKKASVCEVQGIHLCCYFPIISLSAGLWELRGWILDASLAD